MVLWLIIVLVVHFWLRKEICSRLVIGWVLHLFSQHGSLFLQCTHRRFRFHSPVGHIQYGLSVGQPMI